MEISVPFSMVVVSKRNSGKSYLTKHLLKMFMVDNTLFYYTQKAIQDDYKNKQNIRPSKEIKRF